MQDRNVVFDSCCLINLAAAGDLGELLVSTGLTCHLPDAVEAQGVQIRASDDPAGQRREVIELHEVVRAGTLRRCDASGAILEPFLELAALHGNDADAAALAIASVRGWSLASDDRPLWRLAHARRVPILTTAQLLRLAATNLKLSSDDVRRMIGRVEALGRWSPRNTDPGAAWWSEYRERTG